MVLIELPIEKSDWSASISLGMAMADLTGIEVLRCVFDDRDLQYDPMRVAVNHIVERIWQSGSGFTLREVLASSGFSSSFLDSVFRTTDSFDNCGLEQCARILLYKALAKLSGQGVVGAAQVLKTLHAYMEEGDNGFPMEFHGMETNYFFESKYGRVMLLSRPYNARDVVDTLRAALGLTSLDATTYNMYFHGTSWVNATIIAQEGIDVFAGRSDRDFGCGFYVSESLHFSSCQACRIHNYQPAVVVYAAKRDWLAGHAVLHFPTATADWQQLTTYCRNTAHSRRKVVARTSAYEAIAGPIVKNPFCTENHVSITYDGTEPHQTCIVTQALADEFSQMQKCILILPQGCTPECLLV